MYTALYRAQRPEVFEEILGQEHIVKILKNQLNTDTVSHAYLFCGTRGTGKPLQPGFLPKVSIAFPKVRDRVANVLIVRPSKMEVSWM